MPAGSRNGVGESNGPRYKAPFSRWFRYPAGFSVEALNACFESLDEGTSTIVDPFAGVATGAIAAAESAIRFAGIEAHPEIAELAQAKFISPEEPERLIEAVASVVGTYTPERDLAKEPDAVRRSFAPDVLSTLAGLRSRIKASESPWRTHMKWALLGTLRDVATSGVAWPYQRPGIVRKPRSSHPIRRFQQRAKEIADDLKSWMGKPPDTLITPGDSRRPEAWNNLLDAGYLPAGSVSSPPYLNNFDYADATRLEIYFWGVARTWSQMVEQVRTGMMLAATHQTSLARATVARKRIEGTKYLQEILDYADQLEKERRRRGRGKEYDRLILCYFADLLDVLAQLHRVLPTGAPVAWVVGDSAPYGIHVDTPQLILRAAESIGFRPQNDRTLRSRGLRWRSNGTRHQVDLTERMISFRCIK